MSSSGSSPLTGIQPTHPLEVKIQSAEQSGQRSHCNPTLDGIPPEAAELVPLVEEALLQIRLDLHTPDVLDVLGELCGQEERDAQVVVLVPNLGIDLLQNLDEPRISEAAALIRSVTTPLQNLGVRRVALFGSTARGDARPDSDVDLLLEFDKGRKTFDAFMDAADILEDTFPVPVDVLTLESFDDRRRVRIRSEAVYFEIKP